MIIVEDGSGLNPDANSYSDLASLKAYAKARNIDISDSTDEELEAFLILAMDWIEAQQSRFRGYRTRECQPLDFPRCDVWVGGVLVKHDVIPRQVKAAQLILALEAKTHDLMPTRLATDQGAIVRERIEGVIDTEYAQLGDARSTPFFAKAEAVLEPLLKSNLSINAALVRC